MRVWKPEFNDVFRVAASAVHAGGERVNVARTDWDISGNCENPHFRLVWASQMVTPTGRVRPHASCEVWTRCRKCGACLRARGNLWRTRAISEYHAAPRTWFATLTLSAEQQFRILSECRQREALQGVDYDQLPTAERFVLRHNRIGKELTRWLKRLRKAGLSIRYLLVAEAHKSGDPHYHMLIHEAEPDRPVKYADLKGTWKWGFSQFKLVTDPRQAAYVTKYLVKNPLARVRASKGYGSNETLPSQGIGPRKSVRGENGLPRNEHGSEGQSMEKADGISSSV